jgi:hypothetical protein
VVALFAKIFSARKRTLSSAHRHDMRISSRTDEDDRVRVASCTVQGLIVVRM